VQRKPASLTAAVLTAGALVLGLAACAPQGDGPSGAQCTPAGPVSDGIQVTGEFGGELRLDLGDPISVTDIQRSVAIQGTGDGAEAGQTVNAYYTVFDGTSGEVLERGSDVADGAVPFLNDESLYSAGVVAALTCSTDGSRVVAAMPAGEAFGENATALGLTAESPIVLVLDVETVEDTVAPEATGAPEAEVVERDAALTAPAVDLSGAVPVVTLPEAAPPSDFQLEVLEPGDGEVVPAGATVTVDYHGVSWDTGEVFDSSYARGAAATFSTDGVIQGFRDALVGQQVGATVIATIPPDLAYGTDPTAHRLGGQTLVFVVHIESIG